MEELKSKKYWKDIVSAFPMLSDDLEKPEECDSKKFKTIKKIIIKKKISTIVSESVMKSIINEMSLNMTKQFWIYFVDSEDIEFQRPENSENTILSDLVGFRKFQAAASTIYKLAQSHMNTINRLQKLHKDKSNKIDMIDDFQTKICALIRSQLPVNYKIIVQKFYRIAIRVIVKDIKKNTSKEVSPCECCNFIINECKCAKLLETVVEINWQLNTAGILDALAGETMIDLIYMMIIGNITVKHDTISKLENWMNTQVYEWMKYLIKPKCSSSVDNPYLDTFMKRVKYLLYYASSIHRIENLYEMISKNPNSMQNEDSLTALLREVYHYKELTKILHNSVYHQLLQQNMSTVDVVYVYISTITVLRIIDSSGFLLKEVTRVIQNNLRNRKDTVRSIITVVTAKRNHLIDDIYDTNDNANKKEKAEDKNASNPCNSSKCSSGWDIVTLLVNDYGSPEIFANEYKTLLADRILAKKCMSYRNYMNEKWYLKSWKSKFGDSLFHSCTVMLKDVFYTNYTNTDLYSKDQNYDTTCCIFNHPIQFPVKAIIFSDQYWPKFRNNYNLNLPSIIEIHLEYYKKSFEIYKNGRTIVWNPNVGLIEMDIMLNNNVLSLTVSPIHATIIWQFQHQVEWTIDDLSIKLNIPAATIQCYIIFWISYGVLIRKSIDTFTLSKNLPDKAATDQITQSRTNKQTIIEDDGTVKSAILSVQEERDILLQELWSSLENVLRSRLSLTIEKIQQISNVFSSDKIDDTQISQTELCTLLNDKIKEQRLTLSNGIYTLAVPDLEQVLP